MSEANSSLDYKTKIFLDKSRKFDKKYEKFIDDQP